MTLQSDEVRELTQECYWSTASSSAWLTGDNLFSFVQVSDHIDLGIGDGIYTLFYMELQHWSTLVYHNMKTQTLWL